LEAWLESTHLKSALTTGFLDRSRLRCCEDRWCRHNSAADTFSIGGLKSF
jgi:hypothetical protein